MGESSCRVETSPLIRSADQWNSFCVMGTSIMKGSRRSSSTYTESLFLQVVKHNLLFFSVWLFFHEYPRFTEQHVKGVTISLFPFYHSHLLHRHLDISCNQFHNILELFDVLPNFPFTTAETMCDYYL